MAACPSCGADNPERARFCLECGTALASAAIQAKGESRRTVTILFSDVVESTAFAEQNDAEAVWPVMSGYFDQMRAVIERHGGTVEKFIGDAIMAVFGLTGAREDDALRAVRAADGMRTALAGLNERLAAERGLRIAARTGINTGEVLVPEGGDTTLATGDAVNTAARLEQAASPNEILLSESTLALVAHAIESEPVDGIRAKGKAMPLRAARLLSVKASATARAEHRTPLVGRQTELELLREVWRAATAEGAPRLVSVLGTAGVGKSRLVAEFMDEVAAEAAVLRGRCLSYGDGLTYWPIREIVFTAAAVADDDTVADVEAKLRAVVAASVDGPAIAATIGRAVGLGGTASADEIAWAVRRFLELLAAERPLVSIVEDVHWAQAPLLELLERVRDQATGPLLIICPARPEFAEMRPDWLTDGRTTTIKLDSLPADTSDALIDLVAAGRPVAPQIRARVLSAAEGNPLFLEELVRLVLERGDQQWTIEIPPTIQALMAARVDQLPAAERSVAQSASVIGRVFERPALAALVPEGRRQAVESQLESLVRKEILTVEQAAEAAFKFRHILIRDAAYQALPKAERAALHEAFADWLAGTVGDRMAEYDELIGFHLAEAFRYRVELRHRAETAESLGRRAATHLQRAARAANLRGDATAAVALFERSTALPQESAAAAALLLVRLADATQSAGQYDVALQRAEAALAMAREVGDRGVAALAQINRLDALEVLGGIVNPSEEFRSAIDVALSDAVAANYPLAIARALQARSFTVYLEGNLDESHQDIVAALQAARAADEDRLILDLELGLLVNELVGSTAATEVAEHARGLVARTQDFLNSRSDAMRVLSIAEAMLQMPEDARRTLAEAVRLVEQLGRPLDHSIVLSDGSWVERLIGDLDAAEDHLLHALALVSDTDQQSHNFLSSRLIVVLVAQGRLEEAEALIAEVGEPPQLAAHVRLLGAKARIHASRGDSSARETAAQMLEMIKMTSFVNVRTDVLIDAGETMAALGDRDGAMSYFMEAIALCDVKQNLALAAQLRARLTSLGGAPS